MTTSESQGPVPAVPVPVSGGTGTEYNYRFAGDQVLVEQALGVLRIEIHGSWSVDDLIKLLGRLEDGYKAAAALESLCRPGSRRHGVHPPDWRYV